MPDETEKKKAEKERKEREAEEQRRRDEDACLATLIAAMGASIAGGH